MPKDFSKLPYRPCVGIMLLNDHGLVWVGRRIAKWEGDGAKSLWQMPQGGIDEGESPEQAALRELAEETGATSVEVIAQCPRWLSYDLPKQALGIGLKGKYRGQTQMWFAMRFLGRDMEFNIAAPGGKKAEFDAWKWITLKQAGERIIAFKRPVYDALAKEFGALVS